MLPVPALNRSLRSRNVSPNPDIRSLFNPDVLLTPNVCAATLAKRNSNFHAFLVIERVQKEKSTVTGLETQKLLLFKADFYKNLDGVDVNNSLQMSSADYSGTGYLVVQQIQPANFLQTYPLTELQTATFELTKEKCDKLLKRLGNDVDTNRNYRYTKLGNNQLSSSSPSDTMHNCISYLCEVLREEANIQISNSTSLANPFMPKHPEWIIKSLAEIETKNRKQGINF